MKKNGLLLIFLLMYVGSFAQPFQSIFGKEKTVFKIYKSITCYDPDPGLLGCGYTFGFETTPSDTVSMNGFLYQILTSDYTADQYEYLREDTLTGKIYRYIPDVEEEFLTCDMTLNVGDTFQLPIFDPFDEYPIWNYAGKGTNIIVKQIDTVDGRKIITFYNKLGLYLYDGYEYYIERNIFLKFIEGVGPIYSPLGFLGGNYGFEPHLGVVLCIHRDDTLYYMTSELLGCYQYGSKVDEIESSVIKIYPNPATDIIHFEIDNNRMGGKLVILNGIGMVIFQEKIETNPLEFNVSTLPAGVYSVLYETSKERIVSKFIKIK